MVYPRMCVITTSLNEMAWIYLMSIRILIIYLISKLRVFFFFAKLHCFVSYSSQELYLSIVYNPVRVCKLHIYFMLVRRGIVVLLVLSHTRNIFSNMTYVLYDIFYLSWIRYAGIQIGYQFSEIVRTRVILQQ